MLTNEDIQKLTQVFATKEEFHQFRDEMKADFNRLLTAIDSYAKKADTYFQEMVMLSHKVNLHEKWLRQIADNLNIKLDYATQPNT